jgi:predicted aldo/keto reductase-like oxidoreductase
LAYRYVRSQRQVATALAGAAHIAELDELLTYSEPLPAELLDSIRQEPMLAKAWLHPGLWPSG